MNIFYLVFGTDISYHLEAYLSIRSIQKQLTPEDRIFVQTTNPEFYKHASVEILPLSAQQIEKWKGTHDYIFRVKTLAIKEFAQEHPEEDLLYLDTDTFLYGQLDELRLRLQNGQGLMHKLEGHPESMKWGTHKMWKIVKGRSYRGITLGERHNMWNSGVLGIPASKAEQVLETSLSICDMMLDEGIKVHIIEQYCTSVAMEELTNLRLACDHIGHYWGNKREWHHLSATIFLSSLMRGADIEEEKMALTHDIMTRLPVSIHRPTTAVKIKKVIDKLFPNNNYQYVGKE